MPSCRASTPTPLSFDRCEANRGCGGPGPRPSIAPFEDLGANAVDPVDAGKSTSGPITVTILPGSWAHSSDHCRAKPGGRAIRQ
jgi:hypothetical protein